MRCQNQDLDNILGSVRKQSIVGLTGIRHKECATLRKNAIGVCRLVDFKEFRRPDRALCMGAVIPPPSGGIHKATSAALAAYLLVIPDCLEVVER